MSDGEKAPTAPPLLVEVTVETLDEGSFVRSFNTHLVRAARELREARAEQCRRGIKQKLSMRIKANVKLILEPESDELLAIECDVSRALPNPANVTFARLTGETILAQPGGTTPDSPDQLHIFNRDGKPSGEVVDTNTGEVKDKDGAVKGTIEITDGTSGGPIPFGAARKAPKR